jgi:hypothetical protein
LFKKITPKEWLQIQEKFLKAHVYFTTTAQKLRNKNKNTVLNKIQQQLKNI